MLARKNFGCGSSREHAPWALQQAGYKALIAPSFADIFLNNSFKNGLLPVVLTEAQVDKLFHEVAAHPGYRLTIDLPAQIVVPAKAGTPLDPRRHGDDAMHFDIEPSRKESLLNGWDEISLTLKHKDEIKAYEERRKKSEPWIFQ
jgi:3-isopropylmalate/(R)-2-methylmalate dehydratase small subunit